MRGFLETRICTQNLSNIPQTCQTCGKWALCRSYRTLFDLSEARLIFFWPACPCTNVDMRMQACMHLLCLQLACNDVQADIFGILDVCFDTGNPLKSTATHCQTPQHTDVGCAFGCWLSGFYVGCCRSTCRMKENIERLRSGWVLGNARV